MDEKSRGLPLESIFFIFGFIFLYVSMSYLGAPMELAAIASGTVIIGVFAFFNWQYIRSVFVLKAKQAEPKVIDGEIVEQEEKLNEPTGN